MKSIEASKISKSYVSGDSLIQPLKDVSLSLEPGSFLAIVGKSGSGKSTLLNILAGLESPDSGSVSINQRELSSLSAEARAEMRLQRVGIVFQFFNLIETLSISQNVELPARLAGVARSEAKERAESLLSEVGIVSLADKYPHEVSGGELQRAALARALINKPACVLADEPTGNLDPASAEVVLSLLQNMVSVHKLSLIIVTHDELVSSAAQRICRLENGYLI